MPKIPGRAITRLQVPADRLEVAWFVAAWDIHVGGATCCVAEHGDRPLRVDDPRNQSPTSGGSAGRVNIKGTSPYGDTRSEGTIGWACPICVDIIAGLGGAQ